MSYMNVTAEELELLRRLNEKKIKDNSNSICVMYDIVKNCIVYLYSKGSDVSHDTTNIATAFIVVGGTYLTANERCGVALIMQVMNEAATHNTDSLDISDEIYTVCFNTTESIYKKAVNMEGE